MIQNKLFLLVISFFLIFALYSCSHDTTNIDNLPQMSFSQDILPVFQTNCAISGCHDQNTAKEGKIYDSYQNIIKSIKPGDPEGSKAYKAITDPFETMPPQNPLLVSEREKIRLWILQGAIDN